MYVSDELYQQFLFWKLGDIVIITAQTGAGKTYFVLNQLLPFLHSQEKRLLYLSNRTALRDQVGLAYDKKYSDNILTINYQEFEKINLDDKYPSERAMAINNCSFWIMDEAHYFLTDAPFNGDVLSCLNTIQNHRKHHVLVFMTATPEYLLLTLGECKLIPSTPPAFNFFNGSTSLSFDYICKGILHDAYLVFQLSSPSNILTHKESTDRARVHRRNLEIASDLYTSMPTVDNFWALNAAMEAAKFDYILPNKFQEKIQDYQRYFEQAIQDVYYYHAGDGYSYVRPAYFSSLHQLCDQIQKTPSTEKWMIFVSSKKTGEKIRLLLKNKEIDSTMITATSKELEVKGAEEQPWEYQVYHSIVTTESSPERITIATAVLDNGINLRDRHLKHIAILEMNPTTFLQMLGRKRLSADEKYVTVYFQKKDVGEVKAFFQKSILQYVKFIVELLFVNNFDGNAPLDHIGWRNLNTFCQTYQTNGHFTPPYDHYVMRIKNLPYTINKNTPNYTCRLFEPNPYTSVRLAYDYYRMLALLEQYENLSEEEKRIKKESLWIEHQLSWLGLQYDPTCWIDYEQHIKAKKIISTILARRSGNVLSCTVQRWLKRAVQQAVLTSHPPLKVKIGAASLKKVNEALIELGYDKQIKSKNRSINGVQRNYWTVVPAGDDQ